MCLICRLKLLFTIHYYQGQLVDVQGQNQSLDHSSKGTVGDQVKMEIEICVHSHIRLPPGKIYPDLSPEFTVLKVENENNRYQLVLNNGAIIGHDDMIAVVNPHTKKTYECCRRPLHSYTLIVGESPDLVKHLSNRYNVEVPQGSHLSFKHVLYFYFNSLKIT